MIEPGIEKSKEEHREMTQERGDSGAMDTKENLSKKEKNLIEQKKLVASQLFLIKNYRENEKKQGRDVHTNGDPQLKKMEARLSELETELGQIEVGKLT